MTVLSFGQWQKRLRVRPRADDTVAVDLLGVGDKTEFTLIDTKEAVCESFLDAGMSYLDHLGEDKTAVTDECYHAELSATVTDGRNRLTYYREHGTQRGYEPTIEEWQVERFVRHCVSNEWLGELIQRTDALEPFVRSLPDRDDDEFVRRCYENLLTLDHEFRRPTVDVLAESNVGDYRARRSLLTALWADAGYRDVIIEELAQVPNQQVIEDVTSLLPDAADDPGRRDECLAALELFSGVSLQNYLNESELNRIKSTVKNIQANASDTDIQDQAASVLSTL